MRIAVITPTVSRASLDSAMESVAQQRLGDGFEVFHFIIGDGRCVPEICIDEPGYTSVVVELSRGSRDAGATPRAVGAAYALGSIKPDMMAFLDDDVEYTPGHLARAAEYAQQGADVITSRRYLCEYDTGARMRVDTGDSDGVQFADTNTIVLANRAVKFATTWGWSGLTSGADRDFWIRLKHSTDRIAHTGQPTVLYRTPWAAHYVGDQFKPPDPAKFVAVDENGKRIAVSERAILNPMTGRWVPESQHRVLMSDKTITKEELVCLA